MGRLKSLTILLTLGAWATATDGAPMDDAPQASTPAARKPPPVNPSEYVKAAVKLAKSADPKKAARAIDYAKAADAYRDMLTTADQAALDKLMAQLAPPAGNPLAAQVDPAVKVVDAPPASVTPVQGQLTQAPATAAPIADAPPQAFTPSPLADQPAQGAAAAVADAPPSISDSGTGAQNPAIREKAIALVAQARAALKNNQVEKARELATEAAALNAPFAADEDHPNSVLAAIGREDNRSGGLNSRGTAPTDAKQTARWLLQSAHEQIALGHYDDAAQKIAQARSYDVRWNLFDDTPDKVQDALDKARPKTATGAATVKGDKRQAESKLREARALIAAGQPQQAESIALEVAGWNLRWGLMGDNPTKVASAARALRRRDATRSAGVKGQPSDAMYNGLVAASRKMMLDGRLDEAEAKAKQALAMNVTPSLTADRAEIVLNDIAAARASATPAPTVANAPAPADANVAAAMTTQAPVPVQEPASARVEREANDLLASGDREKASSKFVEAQKLKAQEEAASVAPAAVPAAAADPAPAVADTAPALGTAPAPVSNAPSGTTLDQARALLANGNYPAARQAAQQAKTEGAGLDADQVIAQIGQTEQAAALKIYAAALASIRKGSAEEMGHAKGLLSELQGMELDESTKQRVEDLLMKLPSDNAGHAQVGVSALDDKDAVAAQKLNAEVGTKISDARRLMETDPDKAIALLTATIEQVKAANLKESVTRQMVRRLEVTIELTKKDKLVFDQKMKDKAFKAEIENKRLRILEADKAKKERMKVLMSKAETAMTDGKFEEAEKCYALAVEIDPNEVAAIAGRTLAQTRRYYSRDLANRRAKENTVVTVLQDVDRTAIVSEKALRDSIDVGDGFAALSANRFKTNERLAIKKSSHILETEKVLAKPITLNLAQGTTLGEGLKYIGELTGLNIVVDKNALAEEALTLNSPVDIHANHLQLRTILKYLLADLKLSYHIDEEGVLLITSPQANNKRTYPVVYSVADLVIAPPQKVRTVGGLLDPTGDIEKMAHFNDPAFLQDQAMKMNGGSGAFDTQLGSSGMSVRNGEKSDRPMDMDPLISLIKTAVAPGTWSNDHSPADAMGGSFGQGAGAGAGEDTAVGSITPFYLNISLIIRHTAEVHDQVTDLLRQLRRLQDLQVSVEVRFITVSDSFYEQIGVDFDFSIQSDAIGRKSSFAIPNPAVSINTAGNTTTGNTTGGGTTAGTTAGTSGSTAGTVGPYLINPIRDHTIGGRPPLIVGAQGAGGNTNPGQFTPDLQLPFTQGSAGQITPFNAASSAGAAATFGIAFLSDLEVYLFLTAVQGDTRSNVVQAPKVTSFNGAPAAVQNGTQRYFVYSLTPVLAAGAIAYQPQVQGFNDGVFMTVTPVVSADRRYVRMTLSPVFNTLIQFETFQVPAAVGSLGGLGGQGTAINAQIQLPIFSNTTITTTVTVPDGGTVLLGGVKRLREERTEFGVPILSKTPLIDRLFRNIGIGRTTDSLMLMVTPRIIILEEEEEKLGIPAVQNITF